MLLVSLNTSGQGIEIMKTFRMLAATLLLAVMVFTLGACGDDKKSKSNSDAVKIQDRFKDKYKLYSNKSVTKPPKKGLVVGDGSKITVGYDGSEGDGLYYQIFYVDKDGVVFPMGGSFFNDEKNGKFSQEITEFTTEADGRDGFLELTTIYVKPGSTEENAVANSKVVNIGMYPVKLKIKK